MCRCVRGSLHGGKVPDEIFGFQRRVRCCIHAQFCRNRFALLQYEGRLSADPETDGTEHWPATDRGVPALEGPWFLESYS